MSDKTTGQPIPNPPPVPGGRTTGPAANAGKEAAKATTWVVAVLLLFVAGGAIWYSMNQNASPPVADASPAVEESADFVIESEPVEDAAGETASDAEAMAAGPETEAAAAPAAPTTGTLDIRSDVSGADVFLDGERVGTTPHKVSGLTPGSYHVKVVKAGNTPFEQRVDVAAKRHVVKAKLVSALATLRVNANVPGARVLLDGQERGTTPLELPNLPTGRHELEVSADGYETRTEILELESGERVMTIDLVSPVSALNEAVAVKHKHRIGSCEGVLRAKAGKLEYDSSHKDAFSIELSDVERFSLDKESLGLKVRDGRSYNFSERNENHPALASFHERVASTLEKKN